MESNTQQHEVIEANTTSILISELLLRRLCGILRRPDLEYVV